jgi:hypothetical protein
MQTGANISQLFLSASGFLHLLFFASAASFREALQIASRRHRKDALTKIFVLSNIRFVSGGSSECRGPRDVFAQNFSNPAGLGRFRR